MYTVLAAKNIEVNFMFLARLLVYLQRNVLWVTLHQSIQ